MCITTLRQASYDDATDLVALLPPLTLDQEQALLAALEHGSVQVETDMPPTPAPAITRWCGWTGMRRYWRRWGACLR